MRFSIATGATWGTGTVELTAKIKSINAELDGISAKMAAIEQVAIDNDRGFTDEEEAEHDGLQEQHATKTDEKNRLVKLNDARIDRLNADAARKSQPLPRTTPESVNSPLHEEGADPLNSVENTGANWRRPAQVRYHACQNITGTVNGRSAEERAYRLGMWTMAKAANDLPNRYRGPQFDAARQFVADQWAVHYSGDSNGSHVLVPDEFSSDIIDLRLKYGVARRLFQNEPMSSETKTVPRQTGNFTAYWVGPNTAGTESNMTHDSVNLVARKLMVLGRMAKDLQMDSAIALGDRAARDIAWSFAKAEDQAAFNGDGTSTYGGHIGARTRLQNVDGAGTDSAGLVTGTGNAYSELVIGDFHSVLGKLPSYARLSECRWVVSMPFFFTVMQKLEVALGGTSVVDVQGLQSGSGAYRFLGLPVEFSDAMPSTEGNSQVCAMLGDWQLGAIFGDRSGSEVEFDDTVVIGGVSVWERDEVGIKGVERCDINVHDYGTSSAAGCIVGLQTAAS